MQSAWYFDNASLARSGSEPVLHDLTWHLLPGRTWAVVGPVAAGKTTLAESLLGRHRLLSGRLQRPPGEPGQGVHLVGFREDSRSFSYARHYYQQRFNVSDPQEERTLGQFLTPAPSERLLHTLGLTRLLDRLLIQLSNGQMRRARLARALARQPSLLILDDPFVGLDASGRAEVSDLLGRLNADGQAILLLTRADAVPTWVTDVLELDAGRCVGQGPRSGHRPPVVAPAEVIAPAAPDGRPILEFNEVTVRYGPNVLLDRVNWTVQAGERWAVLGPNGAGKSTLLSLLCGDHPQAFSNDIILFGRRRGTGETIWDVKRPVGLLSPEFHLYFTEPLTAEETAGTGFHDTLVPRSLTTAQRERGRYLFAELAPNVPRARLFSRLSSGEQRLVLLVRALVKEVPLLILDEPFQALDPATMVRARDWLDRHLTPQQTLLFVTHYPEELPGCITHQLQLTIPGTIPPH